ncbi:MAG: AEC family transporter [Ottowia sp.]|uniref:AEC family transporter n=1 Tax=Ottowia sp. TaxID=1898956 RepID=UPI001B50FC64|nr:AEC family transporter [Ottowia sp.]MBP6667378.1 AEC family transporter [Ottowia sp.]MBP7455896.1 AEC family transporter [Ottowia sp.]MBP7457498.1 AEC family transporter [Ottowia sp.]MBP8861378.1 AEC family transporter [Ottowia sp.]MBP8894845.1 AEC family transporter [Ottowia sp.]
MTGILAVTFPFFALVLCGYVAARTRLLPLDAVPGLNMFVLYFALPCMLYRFGSATPAAQLFNPVIALLWLLAAALIVAATAGWARRQGGSWPDAAMGALVAAFPNSGFMGVPLILALLGAGAVGPVMATLLVDLVVTTSLCIGLSQWGAAGEHGPAKAVGRALQGVLRNPMPWSILLGALAGALGFALWAPLGKTVQLLADAASPVALFTIGAVLARSQMRPATTAGQAAPRDVGVLAVTKLLLHPLLVWTMGTLAVRAGALDTSALTPLVLVAALPAASNVSLLAERFGADNGRVARVILWSTALAFFSFSTAVALLG